MVKGILRAAACRSSQLFLTRRMAAASSRVWISGVAPGLCGAAISGPLCSSAGFPFGVPGGDGRGESLAAVGVAVFGVGRAIVESVVGNGPVAGLAGPG